MRKILCRAMLCLCLVLALGPVHTAFAQDLDRIESYAVDVTPNTEDGSLRIQVTLEWTVLAEGPVSWVKIGVPNGSIRQEQALTDNIDRLSFDNSYMYVYFNRDYDDGRPSGSPTAGFRSICTPWGPTAPWSMSIPPAGSTRPGWGR